MASSSIFLTVFLIASTSGFTIQNPQVATNFKSLGSFGFPSGPSTPAPPLRKQASFRNQQIAGYPKVPPHNAHEAGGNEQDLLPPFEDPPVKLSSFRSQSFRRSAEDVKVDSKTVYPFIAQTSWRFAGGSKDITDPPLHGALQADAKAVDPKTGYPLQALPEWKLAGGDEDILELPVEDTEKNVEKKSNVDSKTGYALVADPRWKDAGGNEEILDLPVEDLPNKSDKEAVGPLIPQPDGKNSGGGDDTILDIPLGESDKPEEAVDPKTGYPLVAQPSWKNAGGDESILELPLESDKPEEAVDPKTGYPLVAQPSWKNAGGDESILELPLESDKPEEAVDPKTGYPLVAQPSWHDAGGDERILELPLESEEKTETGAVDPKTGYHLVAQPSWQDAGGNGDILELPLEENESGKVPVDPKTGYPLRADPRWKGAGGDDDILELPLEEPRDAKEKPVDPKTGYPLTTEASWKDAGGNGDILQLPLEDTIPVNELQSRSNEAQYHVLDVLKLTELVPPPKLKNFPVVFGNLFSTPSPFQTNFFQQDNSHALLGGNQKRNSLDSHEAVKLREFFSRPVESAYTFAGPDNTFVTVIRFLSTNSQKNSQTNYHNGFNQNTFNGNGLSNNFLERQSFQTSSPIS